ncbi:hypothetical protein CPB83DRAFT_875400 [Crepidotus variabilis]|uniref:C3H1-type domain-containing protein n=1 Tax=Crepidotus variabilis TaxID=179855 RepID=A0A9P6JRM4_9AGAR|nr:hypothetical protein CPB83DRAFT_875400 [Crepidotus variabilis]
MPFGLTIGTERATALQQSIQDELTKQGYSPDADPVMAEYITIMIINNKTPAQITGELEDLIGADFNPSFTDWLFVEAAKGVAEPEIPAEVVPEVVEPPAEPEAGPSTSDSSQQPNNESSGRPGRNGVYQHALSQALPGNPSAQKRPAPGRSPSPSHPHKVRRTDLPTGPRAMHREGPNSGGLSRSLLDRMGGPGGRNGPKNHQRDDIQARIDTIVSNAPPDPSMMMPPPGYPGMMDMNPMANPLMLQEMMMNQMAMMAQMASSMGIINPSTGQFGGQQGFPPQQGGMPGDMGMFPPNMNGGGFPPQQVGNGGNNNASRGRGGGRGGRGSGRGRGASNAGGHNAPPTEATQPAPPTIVAPSPIVPTSVTPQGTFAVPERPQSPTLCKFGLKCTNARCRYSHPSPVATPESGVVLSNDPCENGKNCKDKDCIKAHVSPAVLNPNAEHSVPKSTIPPPQAQHPAPVACRFGASCTRPNCTFNHPPRATQSSVACRFGSACTRANCTFQHPEGRVLPTTFHRGLSSTGPIVSVTNPETGSMGGPSPHRSMTFNNSSAKEKLEKQMKEIQEKKDEAEKAVKAAEAAANSKKDGSKSVSIAA